MFASVKPHIRAEIEAQLGLKRAEIRNRLQG